MPLILAIEPDRRQAAQLAAIAQGRIGAELVLAESAERALRALGDRVPDLILTPPLLSPRDDAAITDRLRELGTAATYVQTLTIPALATAEPGTGARARGLLSALRRQKAPAPAPNGCAPEVFAEQIAGYLERALEARNAHRAAEPPPIELEPVVPQEPAATMLDEVVAPEPLPAIEPEWPVHVEATVTPEVAIPVQDFWEPVHAESHMDTGVDVPTQVGFGLDHDAPRYRGTEIESEDVAIPMPEPAIESEWPVHVEVAVTADVARPVQDFWEPVHAESRVDTGVDVAIPMPELAIEPEWPVHLEVALAEEPVALAAAAVTPIAVETVAMEAAAAMDVAVVEAKTPPEVTPLAWVETDLTELVDAIAEPAVDLEPEILETPQETPQPLPVARVPEVPLPTPAPPKAARPANRKRRARPAPPKDDWHFFDPEETRFAALLAKLDEITRTDAASHSPRPRA